MSDTEYITGPIPDGYQIYSEQFSIAGLHLRKYEAQSFIGRNDRTLSLEPEPHNTKDPNALKILGTSKGWFFTSTVVLGYVPKEIAAQVAKSNMQSEMLIRLMSAWVGDRGGVDITAQLLGPKGRKKEFQGAHASHHTKMSPWQKEFFRFIAATPPKDATEASATNLISERLAALRSSDPDTFANWSAYEAIWEELSDTDFRSAYEIKKVSLPLFRKSIDSLLSNGSTLPELSSDIDFVVDELLKLKPDLSRG